MSIRFSRLSVALALLAPAAAAAPGDVKQNGSMPVILNAEGSARQLTVVDLDGDGRMDLVRSNSRVNVWRQVEGGHLTPVAEIKPGGNAVVADLDGDGALSIVTVGSFVVNAAEFTAPFVLGPSVTLAGPTDGGGFVFALAADFDGDGHPDVLADRGDTLRLWRGDGSGGLLPSVQAAGLGSTQTEAGDLDLDGTLDVLAGHGTDAVPLLGQGDGSFVAQAPIAMLGAVTQIALGHLDGDGRPDAAAATLGGLQLLLGTSGGGFAPWASTTELARAVALGDTDGDGDDDVVEGLNSIARVHLVGAAGLGATRSFEMAGSDVDVAVAHLDGEAAATVIASSSVSSSFYVDLLLADCAADGLPALEQTFPQVAQPLALADVDGDGHKDLVTWQQVTNEIVVHAIPGDGTIGPAGVGTPVATNTVSLGAQALQLDGDAHEDLMLVVSSGTALAWIPLRSNGDGSFTPGPAIPKPVLSKAGEALADIDGDGDLDLVFVSSAGIWHANLGDGSFGPALPVTIPQPWQPNGDVATGDVNEDGFADVLVGTPASEGVVHEWLGLGDGDFAPPVSIPAGPYGTPSLLVDDVDGDGHLDLLALGHVATGFAVGQLTVLHGHGDGSFSLVGHFPIADFDPFFAPSTTDFDRDGRKDVVVWQETSNRLALMPQAADGTFGGPQALPFLTSWLLTADVDGDGHEDCLSATKALDPTTGEHALRVGWTRIADGALDLGHGKAGSAGLPVLTGGGTLQPKQLAFLELQAAPPGAPLMLVLGLQTAYVPVGGLFPLAPSAQLVPEPQLVLGGFASDASGSLTLKARWPADAPPGLAVYAQIWCKDPLTGQLVASNALQFEGD